jgi:hypothetical protein
MLFEIRYPLLHERGFDDNNNTLTRFYSSLSGKKGLAFTWLNFNELSSIWLIGS